MSRKLKNLIPENLIFLRNKIFPLHLQFQSQIACPCSTNSSYNHTKRRILFHFMFFFLKSYFIKECEEWSSMVVLVKSKLAVELFFFFFVSHLVGGSVDENRDLYDLIQSVMKSFVIRSWRFLMKIIDIFFVCSEVFCSETILCFISCS